MTSAQDQRVRYMLTDAGYAALRATPVLPTVTPPPAGLVWWVLTPAGERALRGHAVSERSVPP